VHNERGVASRSPAFQFDDLGQPLKRLPELIAVLPGRPGDGFRNAALWLFAADAALGGRNPADVFPNEPGRVIALRRHQRDPADGAE